MSEPGGGALQPGPRSGLRGPFADAAGVADAMAAEFRGGETSCTWPKGSLRRPMGPVTSEPSRHVAAEEVGPTFRSSAKARLERYWPERLLPMPGWRRAWKALPSATWLQQRPTTWTKCGWPTQATEWATGGLGRPAAFRPGGRPLLKPGPRGRRFPGPRPARHGQSPLWPVTPSRAFADDRESGRLFSGHVRRLGVVVQQGHIGQQEQPFGQVQLVPPSRNSATMASATRRASANRPAEARALARVKAPPRGWTPSSRQRRSPWSSSAKAAGRSPLRAAAKPRFWQMVAASVSWPSCTIISSARVRSASAWRNRPVYT